MKSRKENSLVGRTLALNLTFSPQEKEQQPRIFSFVEGCPANSIAGYSVKAANVSPSPSVFASLRRDCKSAPRRSAA